jgi:hypothetical protein
LELDQIEDALEIYLPVSIRQFLSIHGPVFVPDLWDIIVEKELGVHPLREFLKPAEIINDNRAYWSGGMPRNFLGVAGDLMGNLFGFPRVPRDNPRPDDLPISLFDHDYLRINPVSGSFDKWLMWFVDNLESA